MDRGLFHYAISPPSHHILLPKFKIKNKIKLNSLFLEENSLLKELKELKMPFSLLLASIIGPLTFNCYLGVNFLRFTTLTL